MFTDQQFLDYELNDLNVGFGFDEYETLMQRVADYLMSLNCQSFTEIGAGTGVLLYKMHCLTGKATGIDVSKPHKEYFDRNKPGLKHLYHLTDLQQFDYKPADVFCSLEVFEHITDEKIHFALKKISQNCKFFLFSSPFEKSDMDDKIGHINIKSEAEWIDLFSKYGLTLYERPKVPVKRGLMFTV